MIPDSLATQPIFLCVDDTMVAKTGTRFENVSKLFDHAAHNGSNYLNGHCFVSIMLCTPVWKNDRVSYLSLPLGYRMWQKKESKLELAASMIRQVMPEFQEKKQAIILCDSWYTKQNLGSIVDEYQNLDLIGNARIDSVMYDPAPAHTGRRGRPAKHGKRLSVETDFAFSNEKIGDYYIGAHRVITNLFGCREIQAYVTATEKEHGTKRLFFSTIFPEDLQIFCAYQEKEPLFLSDSLYKNKDILAAITYINQHLTADLSLETVAKALFMSPYSLSRTFKKETGVAFHAYVVKKRLLKSKEILRKTRSATATFEACGFNSYTHFLRCFKQEFQLTPKEFLQEEAQNQFVRFTHFAGKK